MKKQQITTNDGEIYLDDTIDRMKKFSENSIDMILADLPYGTTNNQKDIKIPFDLLWEQYLRIIKENGVIALFAQGLFYVDLVNSNRKIFRYDLIWDKVLTSGFLNAKKMPLRQHEQIAIFYKKLPTYNPQMTRGEPLHGKGVAYKQKKIINQNYGDFKTTEDTRSGCVDKYPKSILSFKKPHPSISQHRTEKSIECLEWLIKTYTNNNEFVLDNTAGSGTTGIACKNTGRKYILIDNDETYFQIMIKRLHI